MAKNSRHGCSLGSGMNGKRSNPTISMTEGIVAAEILSRLPVKSLMRFRYVCKSWRELISDPYFVQKHLDRSREKPRLVVVPFSATGGIRSVGFYTYTPGLRARLLSEFRKFSEVQETLRRTHHADGLVLLDTVTSLHVCNPSTGEFLAVPESSNAHAPSAGGQKAALGYAARNERYEAVRCFYRHCDFARGTCSLGLEVFELRGSDGCWRVVSPDPPYPIDTSASPVSIGGVVYFTIDNRLHALPPKAALAFDLDDEKFRVIDRPTSLDDCEGLRLSELGGELCLVRSFLESPKLETTSLDIWTHRREEGGSTWVHAYSVNLSVPWTDAVPVEVRGGKLLLLMINYELGKKHSLELYDPQTGLLETVVESLKHLEYSRRLCLHRLPSETCFRVIKYVESLASIKGVTFYDRITYVESLASTEGATFYDGL